VAAVREAGRRILSEEGPAALTTTRIAERAGVSVGSLYQYFESKEAVLQAIYHEEKARDLAEAADWVERLKAMDPRVRLEVGVRYSVERHKRLLGLAPDFYREHHHEFQLSPELPGVAPRDSEPNAEILARQLLERTRDELREIDLGHAAFLLGRGVPAILRTALEDRPELLSDEGFLQALVDLMARYLFPDADPESG
jgi:AcrR family transcriptional regulator